MTASGVIPRILLGPGPSNVSQRVLDALAEPPIGYLDPTLFPLLDRLRNGLRTVFGTRNEFTLPVTGTGMAGMEAVFANLLEDGDRVVVCVNGFFGARMVDVATRLGAVVTQVAAEWGRAIDPADVRKVLDTLPSVKVVACVHAETSTGVLQPLSEIGGLARDRGALFVADTVTSLGGLPVEIDVSLVDASYSATQKCMGAPPGLSPVTASERALAAAADRRTPVRDWYFDWQLLRSYYDAPHAYHHTVPVNLIRALAESLDEIEEEGLELRFARHREISALLMEGLAELDIRPLAEEGCRLPTLSAVRVPERVADEAWVRAELLQRYGIEIGGGLGPLKGKIWRIGTMGASATRRNAALLLSGLREIVT